MISLLLSVCIAFAPLAVAQSSAGPPNTYPHTYPGKPTGDYGPNWQKYFQVTDPLPNVTSSTLGRNWAGNIGVQRPNHPNDTLFFWGFEQSSGSLTDTSNTKPWGIWLNGGPGSSSMLGLFFENGPLRISPDYSVSKNKYSWSNIADYFWIDNPVGVGYSTADTNGYAANSEQMAEDFVGFLANLVKVFPGLAKRPLYLTGESYAGVYIPYIMKAYFALSKPTFTIGGIAIGDGSISGLDGDLAIDLPTLSIIETYPQLIGYSPAAFTFFKTQEHVCGLDLNFTYPQTGGHFPTIDIPLGQYQLGMSQQKRASKKERKARMAELLKRTDTGLMDKRAERSHLIARKTSATQWLAAQNPNVMNAWYGCDINTMLLDFASNYSAPYNVNNVIDYYDIPDATKFVPFIDASVYLNDPRTRKAIHAPSNDWVGSQEFVFGANTWQDSSVQPMAFLTDLATSMTKEKVKVVIFSGNDDALLAHRGSEAVIQNTTFGGVQGFWRKPSTPWKDLNGKFAGIVHQERGWTYALVVGAGHLIPNSNPSAAYTVARDFIIGTVKTGLVTSANTPAVGGEDPSLAGDYYRGQDGIEYLDASGNTKTYIAPKATIAAWNSFIATATANGRGSVPTKAAC